MRRSLVIAMACLWATASLGGDQIRSFKIPDTEISFDGKEKLLESPADGFRPERKDGPIVEFKEYENGEDADVSIIVYVSRYRKPIKADLNSLLITVAATAQSIQDEELGEVKVLKEETTTFGEVPAAHVVNFVKSEEGNFYMESMIIGGGSTETSVTLTYLDEPTLKQEAERLMKSLRVQGSPAGEMKAIKWDD
ncbi:MAG: hypothetical protein ABL949_11735 [Fimbriimonadaceae bacterium]